MHFDYICSNGYNKTIKMKKITLAFALLLGFGLLAQEDLADGLYAKIETDKGDILIELEYEKVPLTVANFVALAEGKLKYDTVKIEQPFYDGIKFHRVIADFMIQGGDPNGNGSGGPGYRFPDEFDSTLIHDRAGVLSMANSGPGTNGSQFFITHKDTPWLNGKHAVFGHVVKGLDVVNAIQQNDVIKHVEIVRIGKGAKKFKANKVFNKTIEKLEAEQKAKSEKRNKAFYDENIGKFEGAEQTESGLMYKITKEGNGTKPLSGFEVEVHYTGTFVDGTKFDSSVDRGQTFKFIVDKSRVIKGWHEGIKLCDIGGTIRLILPYWLAYGEHGRATIPPKATLVFDIEVFNSTQDK